MWDSWKHPDKRMVSYEQDIVLQKIILTVKMYRRLQNLKLVISKLVEIESRRNKLYTSVG